MGTIRVWNNLDLVYVKRNYMCTVQGCDGERPCHAVVICLYSPHADIDEDTPLI